MNVDLEGVEKIHEFSLHTSANHRLTSDS